MAVMFLRRFGWLAAAMALLLALSGPVAAMAQDEEFSAIPEGATDGALISYAPGGDADPQAPIYAFSIFTFEDDDAAEAAYDSYLEQIGSSLTMSGEAEAELVEITGDDAEGLEDIGDQRAAYRVEFSGEELSGFSFGFLLVREGSTLEAWTSVVLDLSGLTGGADPSAAPVDPSAGVDGLLGIAPDWFGGDRSDDGELIDQLPGLDQLPDGYEEVQRAEGLDEIEAAGSGAGI